MTYCERHTYQQTMVGVASDTCTSAGGILQTSKFQVIDPQILASMGGQEL